jgi:SAM-dependent methyltransferase
MLKRLRRLGRRALELTGLIGPYYRWVERRLARAPGGSVDDGRPMPPPDLLVAVAGGAGQAWFSERGQADAAKFMRLAAEAGLKGKLDVLDWGCGCGRIARWVAADVVGRGGAFTGCDLNPKLVAWCQANLPGRYFANGLQPPLPLEAESLDLAYAHSVLTHLTEPTARAWLAEVARVLRPGGCALLTFHDETYAQAFAPPEVVRQLGGKRYVVWNNALEGSNYMSAWTTRAYLAELAAPFFDVLQTLPGETETPEQAVAVLRAR